MSIYHAEKSSVGGYVRERTASAGGQEGQPRNVEDYPTTVASYQGQEQPEHSGGSERHTVDGGGGAVKFRCLDGGIKCACDCVVESDWVPFEPDCCVFPMSEHTKYVQWEEVEL